MTAWSKRVFGARTPASSRPPTVVFVCYFNVLPHRSGIWLPKHPASGRGSGSRVALPRPHTLDCLPWACILYREFLVLSLRCPFIHVQLLLRNGRPSNAFSKFLFHGLQNLGELKGNGFPSVLLIRQQRTSRRTRHSLHTNLRKSCYWYRSCWRNWSTKRAKRKSNRKTESCNADEETSLNVSIALVVFGSHGVFVLLVSSA